MESQLRVSWRLIIMLCAVLASGSVSAQSLCVYDPMGAAGPYTTLFKDYQLAARRWGLKMELKPYSDDVKLDADFSSGSCDAAAMLGMRAREYNIFTGTLDAPSVIENYAQERGIMAMMDSPNIATNMVSGAYEVIGLMPIGAAYAIVNDRSINTLERGAGKRVLVMSWDKTQFAIAKLLNINPIGVAVDSMGSSFNEGKADIVVTPIEVFKALQLERGVGSRGGIVRKPLFQFTLQLVSHKAKFPSGFGQQSRDYMFSRIDYELGLVRNAESNIDDRLWIYANHGEIEKWNSTMRKALVTMSNEGIYDAKMLVLLHNERCRTPLEGSECPMVSER